MYRHLTNLSLIHHTFSVLHALHYPKVQACNALDDSNCVLTLDCIAASDIQPCNALKTQIRLRSYLGLDSLVHCSIQWYNPAMHLILDPQHTSFLSLKIKTNVKLIQTCNNFQLVNITDLWAMPKCLATDPRIGQSTTNSQMQVICPRFRR